MGIVPPERAQGLDRLGAHPDDLDDRPEWALAIRGFALASGAFGEGQPLPKRHTREGDDLSPPIAWGDPPPGTRSLALLLEGPAAPGAGPTHWLVVGLKPRAGDLVEGRGSDPSDVAEARALTNDFGVVGWGGPRPPNDPAGGYRFRLFALDLVPHLPATAGRAEFEAAIAGHVVAECSLSAGGCVG